MSSEKSEFVREKPIPQEKLEIVDEIVKNISEKRTVLIASCKSLPGKQFHEIKKSLRGKAEMRVAKKSAMLRAIDNINKGAIKNLKEQIGADIVVLFSDIDPFELSGILIENQSPAKAKAGDIAPEDIDIEAGPTELVPGPAISELGSVGLKVAVKDGKLEIMQGATVVKEGEEINSNVASVLGKLNITPMKVGFIPLAAYDKKEDKIFVDIKIDKEGTLEALREMLGKSLGFAINVSYTTKETISYLIGKASAQEKVLGGLVKETGSEEKTESEEEEKKEEPQESEEQKTEEQPPEEAEADGETKGEESSSETETTKEETQ